MKKSLFRHFATWFLASVMVVSFAACSDNEEPTTSQPAPGSEAVKLPRLLSAIYRTDNSAGIGNYELLLGTADELAWEGDVQLFLNLYAEKDADPLNAVLPNGTYEASSEVLPNTFNAYSSSLSIVVDGSVQQTPLLGTVTVSRTGGQYTVTAQVQTVWDEDIHEFSYTGPIQFVQGGVSAFVPFETNLQVAFTEAQGLYWGNWFRPYADDFRLELYAGDFDENGTLTTGYRLNLTSVYMPKAADYNLDPMPIAAGTYTVLEEKPLERTLTLPWQLDAGEIFVYMEVTTFSGSYLQYVNAATGEKRIGLIHSGSFTVEGTVDNYTMTFDFVTDEGITINGSYSGKVNFVNNNDNDQQLIWGNRPWTTLEEDHTLNFLEQTEAYAFRYGDYIKEGLDVWMIALMASDSETEEYVGDYFTTEIMVPSSQGFVMPEGEFEVCWEVKPNVALPGMYNSAESPCYTFYGDLTTDEEGYSLAMAAITSGKLTIQKIADSENYRFVFDLVDDGGHKITGEWSGPVDATDVSDQIMGGGSDDDHDHEHSHALRVRR